MIKSKDIYLVIVVVIVSSLFAYLIANALFKVEKLKTEVEVVDVIDPNFGAPDSTYFNPESINPTQVITIGDSENPNPFNNPNPSQ